MLAFQVSSTQLTIEDSDTSESGLGVGLRLGWGATKNFTLFVGIDSSSIETSDPAITGGTYGLMQAAIGGLYNFRAGKKAMPYLEAGLATRRISSQVSLDDGTGTLIEGEAETMGMGFMFGGGLNYFLARTLALNVSVSMVTGHFDDLKINDARVPNSDFNAGSARAILGLTWYPIRD